MNRSAKILIVEDEGIVALDLERQLERLGYNAVAVTSTAEEAVRLAGELRPDLVLMDIHLGGAMDGIEAARHIRAQFSIASVFLTAYATDEVVERAKTAEPLGYVIKPFDEHSLRTSIEIALHKDISDRQLRRSEARYRAIGDASVDAIITIDSAGRIVGWSPGAERMFGHTEAAALGQPSTFFLAGTASPAADEDMARRMWSPDGPARAGGEIHARRHDRTEFPIERSLARWEDADGWYVTAFVRDITFRMQFEKSLRLQAAALRAAANAIVITDRIGAIEWVNPAFSSLTGYSAAEAVGRNPRELVRSGAQDEPFYASMWDTIVAGQVWEGELTNRRKDGTIYRELQTITPVLDAGGTITHFVGIKRDLTAEKRLQEQFLQAQKMEVVGRLAGGIAHDFNNLLTVINGESDLALNDLPAGDPLRAPFTSILEAGRRAARLTAQLLAFSRKQIATPSVVSVSAEVNALAPMLRRIIGEDIALSLTVVSDGDDRVHIDKGQLEQVLLNLAVNARDAMPGGGALSVGVRPLGSEVKIAVTDTGIGIAPDVRARLFEPFFTTKPLGKGTGLGLATVYSVVTSCGGTIDVESVVGHGATFTVALPRSAAPLKHDESSEIGSASSGHETIVLVEDERGVRELTARMLRSVGYVVIPMESGTAALDWFKHTDRPVQLLVSDVVMPGITGPELAAAVAPIRPGLVVLFASGYADDRLTPDVLADPDRFIAKPFQMSALTAKVRHLIDARRIS